MQWHSFQRQPAPHHLRRCPDLSQIQGKQVCARPFRDSDRSFQEWPADRQPLPPLDLRRSGLHNWPTTPSGRSCILSHRHGGGARSDKTSAAIRSETQRGPATAGSQRGSNVPLICGSSVPSNGLRIRAGRLCLTAESHGNRDSGIAGASSKFRIVVEHFSRKFSASAVNLCAKLTA